MAVRPIDANELYRIEKLLDTDIVRQDKVALNLLEQVLYDIQHVPTLTPQNEWVSVEDRMPEELKMVLVYCGGLYDVAGWVKDKEDKICWTCKTEPEFWRPIPELDG